MNYLKTTLFATLVLGAAAFASCDPKEETVAVTGIEITSTPSPLVLAVGGATGKVEAKVLPADATDKSVAWSAAPEGVVTVAADGTVTPVGPGTATITATAKSGVKATFTVTVNTVLKDCGVEFIFNEDETTADMKMLQVSFATGMPIMDITVPGITITKTDGGYSFSGEGLVPTTVMGGRVVPVPSYTITGLSGTVAAKSLSFEMMCGKFPLEYTGSREAENVTATGAYAGDLTVYPPAAE